MKSAKPVAMQLYSLRNEMEKDFYGTLEQVAQMGYDGVEFCGFYDQPAEKIKDALDRLGLQAVSSHQGINTWINEFAAIRSFPTNRRNTRRTENIMKNALSNTGKPG